MHPNGKQIFRIICLCLYPENYLTLHYCFAVICLLQIITGIVRKIPNWVNIINYKFTGTNSKQLSMQ